MLSKLIMRRIIVSLGFLLVLSIVTFFLIQLPPGDFVSTLVAQREAAGGKIPVAEIDALRQRYGTDASMVGQYFIWIGRFVQGDFGLSYSFNQPVSMLLRERLPMSIFITVCSFLMSYLIAIPAGILAAIKQHSFWDYLITFIAFIGIAVPSFLLALFALFLCINVFGVNLLGFHSVQYLDAPWSTAKFLDFLKHLPLPILVAGFSGAASLTRIMRGSLLDEINQQYVVTARAKGLKEAALIKKYPVRLAINPILSSVGWLLPSIISGDMILGVVLGLPTIGPLLLDALKNQDTYLAGALIMIMGIIVVIGTFISDMLLMWADPRIRIE
uniref:Putative ATPbinding peptide transport protein n=1 Tax=termite gut metagenome TaxID=433724 RepID=S0DEP0_9ZZZZ